MKIEMVGGPLDGGVFEQYINPAKPFIILKAFSQDESHDEGHYECYCCYELRSGKLYFVNSKTLDEVKGMGK